MTATHGMSSLSSRQNPSLVLQLIWGGHILGSWEQIHWTPSHSSLLSVHKSPSLHSIVGPQTDLQYPSPGSHSSIGGHVLKISLLHSHSFVLLLQVLKTCVHRSLSLQSGLSSMSQGSRLLTTLRHSPFTHFKFCGQYTSSCLQKKYGVNSSMVHSS